MGTTELQELMTLPQAAEHIGRDRSTLRSAVVRGKLPSVGRIGRTGSRGGIIVVTRSDVESYARKNGIDLTLE